MACKYPALISAVVPFGLVALADAVRRRSPAGRARLRASGWAVVMAPWLAKNVIDTGNPVYPLAYRVFGGRHWDARDGREVVDRPRPAGRSTAGALVGSVVDVAGRSDWQSPLYVGAGPAGLPPARARGGRGGCSAGMSPTCS